MDYYKLRKILIIVCIVSTCLRIIGSTKVFAADDVNNAYIVNGHVYQTDNHFETIRNISRDAQDLYITQILGLLNNENTRNNTIATAQSLYNIFINKSNTIWFYTDVNLSGILYQVIPLSKLTNSNITIANYVWDDCYTFNNVPFLQFQRDSNSYAYNIKGNTGITQTDKTSGTTVPIPIPAIRNY